MPKEGRVSDETAEVLSIDTTTYDGVSGALVTVDNTPVGIAYEVDQGKTFALKMWL